jgi:hypothetical protein
MRWPNDAVTELAYPECCGCGVRVEHGIGHPGQYAQVATQHAACRQQAHHDNAPCVFYS